MIKKFPILIVISSFFCFLPGCSSKEGPYIDEYKNIKGYVIGKETCQTDESKDEWLIDFTYGTGNPTVGDTLILNGATYTNVMKTKDLDDGLKQIGLRVSIDYKSISVDKIVSTGCTVASPVTYPLKEVAILNQFEIR